MDVVRVAVTFYFFNVLFLVALTLETDESYALNVSTTSDGRISANIKAETFFGARHGLETLSQLVIYDDIRDEIQVSYNISERNS